MQGRASTNGIILLLGLILFIVWLTWCISVKPKRRRQPWLTSGPFSDDKRYKEYYARREELRASEAEATDLGFSRRALSATVSATSPR